MITKIQVIPTRWQVTKQLTGMTDADLADGGSDRFVDTMIINGTIDIVAERVRQQLDAGADHVCLSIGVRAPEFELAEWRQLAEALL